MRRKHRWIPVVLFPLLATLLLHIVLRTRVDPLVAELARAQVADLASNLINEAVDEQIEAGNVAYSNLVTLERDGTGGITALTTNMQEMNRLKTQLLARLDGKIRSLDSDRISLSLGNVTGVQLLSGRGPDIPIKVVSVSSSDAVFHGEFSEAGINQTLHRIMLDVSLELLILLPSGTVGEEVHSQVCVAETVLLGPVPGNYTYFNSSTDPSEGIYISGD